MPDLATTLLAAAATAAVSTLGDFIWATWIPRHETIYGFTHGTILFMFIGLFLGASAGHALRGATSGALIGAAAAGSFYVLAPLAGYAVMFFVWIAVWVALGILNERLRRLNAPRSVSTPMRSSLLRGAIGALGSGAAFYLVSGIWSPFDPRGWDFAVHFGAWTLAYLPGFAALLLKRSPR
jgi:hypothetical protein